MSKPLAQEEFTPTPNDFGDGWLTKPAQDLCKIAICFGGFAADELVLAIHRIHRGDGLANITTVTNALQDLYDHFRKESPELYADADAERAEAVAYYAEFVKEREATLGS
jgi:hypothetical protein